MNKKYLLLLVLPLLYFGCTEDEPIEVEVINTDISVSKNQNEIFWIDEDDLNNQIANSFTFNFGNAQANEITTTVEINENNTEVTASISLKPEFQDKYSDSNLSNNTATITLTQTSLEDPTITPPSPSIYDLSAYDDLSSLDPIDVPMKIHIVRTNSGGGNFVLSEIELNNYLSQLNEDFAPAKLNFVICGDINYINNSNYYDLDDNNQEDEMGNTYDIENVINVYFYGQGATSRGHFSHDGIDRFRVNTSQLLVRESVFQHELGHYLDLYHTHEIWNNTNIELVERSNCSTAGDLLCDTPADPRLRTGVNVNNFCNYIGNEIDANGDSYTPLTDNIMSYATQCRTEFTEEQLERVAFVAREVRSYLSFDNCSNISLSEIQLSGDIDFDNVLIGQTETRILTIENTGNESFNVTNITSSNPAFTIVGSSITVQPNTTVEIPIQFAPTQEQSYSGVITIDNTANNANSSNSTIQVTGTGFSNTNNFSNISVTGNLNFGNVEVGQSATETFVINNTGNESFAVSSINFPSSAYTANFTAGTINPSSPQEVIVTFQPTNEQSYNGTVTINHNADGGNNTISISGNGTNTNTGQPNLIYNDYRITSDDNNNEIVEAGEDIDFDIQLQNTGNTTATNIEVIIDTSDPDINISDNDRIYDDMPAGDLEWNGGDFDFQVSSSCPTKTVTFTMQIISDQGSWTDTFTINVQGANNGLPQVYATYSPRDSCSATGSSDDYRLDLNTIYYRTNWNIDNIIGYGSDGRRGMWYRFTTTSAGDYTITLNMNGNPGYELYTVCGAAPIATRDASNGNSETATYTINAANTDIYIRFYDNNDNSNVDFGIAIEH